MQEAWPQSRKAMLGAAGMNQQSKISDAEVDAIANMMDESPNRSNQSKMPIPSPMIGGPQFDVSPEQAAGLMIQNYIKNNGGVIIDNNAATRGIKSGVILG